jgi:chromosome segregation protein
MRERLTGDESVVTADGIWLGRNWLRVSRDKEGKAGVLAREHEMRRLKGDIREMQARFDSAKKLLADGRIRLNQLEERRETLQQDASSLLNEYSEIKAALESAKYQMDQANARKAALAEEVSELDNEKIGAEEQLRESRRLHEQALGALERLSSEKEGLETQREELRSELQRVRAQADEDRQTVQNITIQFESRRNSKESAAQNLERMERQLQQFRSRENEIREQLSSSQTPMTDNKAMLDKQLATRVEVEAELTGARQKVEKVEHELRELDQSRMQVDQSVDAARQTVSEAEMGVQEIRVRREGFAEQLAQTDFDFATLLDEMDEAADVDIWEEKLERVRRKIDRLGPINLAAIDEFKEQSERKEYLDSQLADLNDALSTLEGAIRKIDRETRTRGITGMARPPGKRNSTIHLLSGGEKALTAVALVFAIFELNPAPFCMLDEVDAPLDDANVGRFCDIVREMSDKVQFVFITHNKVTMELARQLSGVTMQEPGVSRLVSVDLDAAVKMAAS